MFYPIEVKRVNDGTKISFAYDPFRPAKEKIIQLYNECLTECVKRNILVKLNSDTTVIGNRRNLEIVVNISQDETSQLMRDIQDKIIKERRKRK